MSNTFISFVLLTLLSGCSTTASRLEVRADAFCSNHNGVAYTEQGSPSIMVCKDGKIFTLN